MAGRAVTTVSPCSVETEGVVSAVGVSSVGLSPAEEETSSTELSSASLDASSSEPEASVLTTAVDGTGVVADESVAVDGAGVVADESMVVDGVADAGVLAAVELEAEPPFDLPLLTAEGGAPMPEPPFSHMQSMYTCHGSPRTPSQ